MTFRIQWKDVSETGGKFFPKYAAEESKSVADLVRQAVDQFLRSRLEDGVTWQNDMTAPLERVYSRVAPAIGPYEIERDIRKAGQDVRAAQR